MARGGGRTADCTPKARSARLRKAEEFLEHADLAGEEAPDTCVSLCVLAGIAAADVICCVRLGLHATGESHDEAIALLASTAKAEAGQLSRLLAQKSRAAYSDLQATPSQARQAMRAAHALLQSAVTLA